MEIPFEMSIAVVKNGKPLEYSGDKCLVNFRQGGLEGIQVLGWKTPNLEQYIGTNLVDGSFNLNGNIVHIDLGLVGKDENGNVRAISMSELKLEPIWFRRVRQDYAPTGITVSCKYCVGWKTNVEGKVHQKIAALDFKSGEITILDRK